LRFPTNLGQTHNETPHTAIERSVLLPDFGSFTAT